MLANGSARTDTRSRLHRLAGAAVVMSLSMAAFSQDAAAAASRTVADCTDGAWAEYNTCLVGSGSEFGRKICDLLFSLDITLCTWQDPR